MSPIHTHMEGTVEVPALERPQLDAFDASLRGLPDAERRRRRIQYLQEVAMQMQMSGEAMNNMGCLVLLRPFLRGLSRKAGALMAAKFEEALLYWDLSKEDLLLDTREGGDAGKRIGD